MSAENPYFQPIGEHCRRNLVTCAPDDALVDVVASMRDQGVSSVIVLKDDTPVGIFTDRDLRNKVVASGRQPAMLKVGEVMNTPLQLIGEERKLYEALHLMSRLGVHRLPVVDASQNLVGIITDSDILRMQAHSPHQLILDIEQAESVDELKRHHQRIESIVHHMSRTPVAMRDLVTLTAQLNDQVLIRLIHLLRSTRHPDLPDKGFAFVVMGSEGRGEQTLATDQDNAILYDDALDADTVARLEAFSIDLIDSLIAIGVPPCKGGIMAKNAAWRRSVSDWKNELGNWFTKPTPEHVMYGSMFFDLRTLVGNPAFEDELKNFMYREAAGQANFLTRMAENMTHFKPPLGWFGRINTEKSGTSRGMIEVKKAGIFAFTDGIKALALANRMLEGNTFDRLDHLVNAGVVPAKEAREWVPAFDFLVRMRLRGQVAALEAGQAPHNYVALDQLTRMEQSEMRAALETVARFQQFVAHHFKLHLVRS